MYYQYFGLQEPPFSIAVNPRYLYMSPRHRDALAHLLYGVGAGGGFILLTGEVGTGKTTLNRSLIEQLPETADVAIVLNPALDSSDLLATVCEELGIALAQGEPRPGLKALTDALHRFLLENHARGRKTVLIIDEAQHLDFEVLEQIRLLTNLETHEEKLLHIILIGQPELGEKLRRPELRQLNQRITARYDLQPLTAEETGAYIRHRLQVAGMPAGRELFPPALTRRVHSRSRGVPRLINLLCDRMLMGAYGQGRARVDNALLRRAVREVMGEEDAGRSWVPVALAAIAVAVVAAALWGFVVSRDGSGASPPSSTASAVPPASLPVAATAPAPAPTAQSADVSWQLSPLDGSRLLASLYGVSLPATGRVVTGVGGSSADPCSDVETALLACVRGSAQTWDSLLLEQRPLLLELRDERRFAARALFLGIVGEEAVVADGDGLQRAPLALLGQRWTGSYWYLWQRPAVGSIALSEGDAGEEVRIVAQLFADLDGQSAPLTEERYTSALTERVRLFQRAHGLQADGVAGELTLRALVLAAGADITQEAARRQVELRAEAQVWP
jgi:general secretion pathway protein A